MHRRRGWRGPAARLAAAGLLLLEPAGAAVTEDLSGVWRFALDRGDAGTRERWFARELDGEIRLPGVLQAQGFGDPVGRDTPWVMTLYDRNWHLRREYREVAGAAEVKVPFLCQPPRHYLGVAWYQRDITVPDEAAGQRLALFLERARWQTTVWLDERQAGTQDSLVAPHEFELGAAVPGTHRLTVRVDNRMLLPYRPDAHAVSDSQGSTWNGIVGRIELRRTSPVWIDEVRVTTTIKPPAARLAVRVGNLTGAPGRGELAAGTVRTAVAWAAGEAFGGAAELVVPLPAGTPAWDEFAPRLQRLTVELAGPGAADAREVTFGLREIGTRGGEFIVNGRPTHLRGTHDGGGFPLTGHPPMDVASWRRILGTCRQWGLNHVRFHSWCPPEAAFQAADELGLLLQPEPGMWNEFAPGSPVTQMLYQETDRMLRAYGNHPSFALVSPSNEPKGRWKEVLGEWVAHYRREGPGRLWTTGTGWAFLDAPGPTDAVDFHATHRFGGHLMRGEKGWFGRDFAGSTRGVDKPVIAHEVGQWCAYPDFSVIDRFTGFLRPGNYEVFRSSAATHGVLARNPAFARASGRLQLQCYKEEIEANLRTPGLGGFQLLDIHDFMGQGTAPVGLLDPFFGEKGYATAAGFRRFCGPTVPLARLGRRLFTTADRLEVAVGISHYGEAPLAAVVARWAVTTAGGATLGEGRFAARAVPLGRGTELGRVRLDLAGVPAPCACRLEVAGDGFANDWNFWVYPESGAVAEAAGVRVTAAWPEAERELAAGGRVLYLPRPGDLDWTCPPMDRLPVFWNRQMNPGWSRMLGLCVEAGHPALAGFPGEDFGDWQWLALVGRARAMNLATLPPELQPIVQPVDDWNRNWKLGLLFEAAVGPGRLLACSIDLERDMARRPEARQFRRSLLAYMASDGFRPKVAASAGQVRGFLFDTLVMAKLGASGPRELLDGDPNTFWLAGGARGPRHPHRFEVAFPRPVPVAGFAVVARQNHREHEGDVRDYLLEAGDADGTSWRTIHEGALDSTWEPQRVVFQREWTVRRLRFTARSGFGGDPAAALAEFAVLHTGPAPGGDGAIEYRRARSASEDVDEGPGE